jgi:hypothetical protein
MAIQNNVTDASFSYTATFNLFSTRTFSLPSAGVRTFYFKMRRLRHDGAALGGPEESCLIYNAAFTVQFQPF